MDFTQKILDLNGEEIIDAETKEVITLKMIASNALMAARQKTDDEKRRDFEILLKVSGKAPVILKAKEISSLQDTIWKVHTTLIAGRACSLLEPKDDSLEAID